jgi:hypothetical protein
VRGYINIVYNGSEERVLFFGLLSREHLIIVESYVEEVL